MNRSLETSATMPADLEQLLRHLAHELRQPLSGIESTAYYLDMVLGEAEPEISQHCERLRRMVQQANWLLDDTSIAIHIASSACAPVALPQVFERIDADLLQQDDRSLELHCPPATPPILSPDCVAPRFFAHLVAFFRHIALSPDPIIVTATAEPGHRLRLTIQAELFSEPAEILRLLDPPAPGGALRRFALSADAEFFVAADDSRLSVSILFHTPAD